MDQDIPPNSLVEKEKANQAWKEEWKEASEKWKAANMERTGSEDGSEQPPQFMVGLTFFCVIYLIPSSSTVDSTLVTLRIKQGVMLQNTFSI